MSTPSPLNPLTERQLTICTYGGAFGLLLTITVLVPHLVVTSSSGLTQIMTALYFITLMAFLLLALLRPIALILLIISGVFAIGMQYIWMKELAFSLTVLLLFIYHVIIIVVLFTEQVPQNLKEKRRRQLAEEQQWAGKL